MYCKKCGAQIPDDAPFCSGCGEPQAAATPATQTVNKVNVSVEAPKKKRAGCFAILGILIVLIVVIVAISSNGDKSGNGNNNTPTSNPPTATSPTPTAAPKLEVLDHEILNDDYWSYVIGHVKNNTNKDYSYVQISINLYKGDTLINSTLDNITNLGAGETWAFKAIIMDESFDSYKIVEVTGW